MTLTADRKHVAVGDTVKLTVHLANAEDVSHVPFHVTFDPTVLRFERGVEGDVLRQDGNGTAFVAAGTSKGDSVVVGLSRLGRVPGVAVGGDLCTLEFTAVGAGDSNLAFTRATVRDSTNRIRPSSFRPATLVVY